MKLLPKLALALVTLGTCAIAGAQPYGAADQERRDRNREEAIANHERAQSRTSNVRQEVHEDANKVRSKTHKAATKTRGFTHRQLNKVRNFGERQQRKLPADPGPQSTDKSPTALGK